MLGAIALAAGCAVDEASREEVEIGDSAAEIRGGRRRLDHPEIGMLFMRFDGKWSSCTATLVDKKIAITSGSCVKYRNQDQRGTYGYFHVETQDASGRVRLQRYAVNGYHNFDGFPHLPSLDPDDIGLVRLAQEVPCSVARPAGLRKEPPKVGTIVSRWGYGGSSSSSPVCGDGYGFKRVRHFKRGGKTSMLCKGDEGGPTMDPDGKVYQINAGGTMSKDNVARVEKEWNGITRVMDGWGRAGRCP